MQHFIKNKLNFLPSLETRKYISKCSRYIIPITIIRAILLSLQSYLLMFLLSDILQGLNILITSVLLCMILLCALIITITSSYKETFIGKVRGCYFKDLATKRIELANDKDSVSISQKLYDWQLHNGGPVFNGNTLLEKHMIAITQAIIACVMILITLDAKSLVFLFCLCIVALITSYLLRIADSLVKKTMEEGMEKLIENNRKGDFYFGLLSSEFSKMKSIRSNNLNHFVEDKYASFMDPMMKVFQKEERGKLAIALLEIVISVIMVIAYVVIFKAKVQLPQILAILNLVIGSISLFRFRNDIELNDFRMHTFLEYLNRKKSESIIQENDTLTNAVELDNISFKYPGEKNNALENISFKFEKGKIYSIVGANGSGKTTLVKIILGVLQPDIGTVVTSNKDAFAYCPQNPVQFSFSVGENISMKTVFDKKRVEELLNGLNLNVDVNQKLGYDYTPIGVDLSGGQIQRMVIARALYSNGEVLIMDEPTSKLDVKAEKEIYDIATLLKGKMTCIFISHRLSSSFFSDEILVMDKGQLHSFGTHEKLLDSSDIYRAMYEKQSEHFN